MKVHLWGVLLVLTILSGVGTCLKLTESGSRYLSMQITAGTR